MLKRNVRWGGVKVNTRCQPKIDARQIVDR